MLDIKEIDTAELGEWLAEESQHDVKLVDIRTPMEVAQGAIPGHLHIPMHQLPEQVAQMQGPEKVVLYCRSGARSAQATAYFNQNGMDNVYNLRGGIIVWAREGRAVV